MMSEDFPQVLFQAALDVLPHAYSPYSAIHVSSAVQVSSGEIYVGCNVENSAYGSTICAEANALSSMVAAGHRVWTRCLVLCYGDDVMTPCGNCRQIMMELALSPNNIIDVVCVNRKHIILTQQQYCFRDLLPAAFLLSEKNHSTVCV